MLDASLVPSNLLLNPEGKTGGRKCRKRYVTFKDRLSTKNKDTYKIISDLHILEARGKNVEIDNSQNKKGVIGHFLRLSWKFP